MIRKRMFRAAVCLFAALFASALFPACGRKAEQIEPPEPERPFDVYNDYHQWTETEGYGSGALVPQGPDGLYMDYYHTLPGEPAYASGRIVVGDSRCCQLGIYEQRAGRSDFASFAVWGGHYVNGEYPPILAAGIVSDIEACFREQIRACGKCTVFFFATVNDYDRSGVRNAESIAAAIDAAEYIASMEYESGGRVYRPRVIVVGFDGCRHDGAFSGADPAVFNRYVEAYNGELRGAVEESPLLSANASLFGTVPEIMNGDCGFINDGLHYDDRTLRAICGFIIESDNN